MIDQHSAKFIKISCILSELPSYNLQELTKEWKEFHHRENELPSIVELTEYVIKEKGWS